MKIIGVTGGIGSGKSIVCKIFQSLGVPIYEADAAAHKIYEKYPELVEKIKNEISPEAEKNGNINRKRLGEIVFNDEKKLKKLNAIVHPLVIKDFEDWKEHHKVHAYLIKEAAILFESGTNEGCDKVISVISPLELRITRIKDRDKKSQLEIEQIIGRQLSDEERIKRSDFIIYNDEKQLVIPQVLKIHAAIG